MNDFINKIHRLKQVTHLTGLPRSTIYMRMKTDFPKPIKLGERSVGWLDSDIKNWLEERVNLTHSNNSPMQYVKGSRHD